MLNFANSIVGYKNRYCFISIKFDVEKKANNLQTFRSRCSKIFVAT